MAHQVHIQRGVYRATVHPVRRRWMMPLHEPAQGPEVMAQPRQQARAWGPGWPYAQVASQRRRTCLAPVFPGTTGDMPESTNVALRGDLRRRQAAQVVIRCRESREEFPDASLARVRRREAAMVLPGISTTHDAMRLLSRRLIASRVCREVQAARAEFQDAMRARAAKSGGLPFAFPGEEFVPELEFPFRDQRRLQAVRVSGMSQRIRDGFGDAQRANLRQLAQVYHYSLSVQSQDVIEIVLWSLDRRLRAARLVSRILQDRQQWPHAATAKAPLPEFPDSSTRATGYPGLMQPRAKWWRRHWHYVRPQDRRQRRDWRAPLGYAEEFTFEGHLLGTLAVYPTYEVEDGYTDQTYRGSLGTNTETA